MFDKWISSHRIRNSMMGDPILDWLELYGTQHGFKPDDIKPIFIQFLSQKRNAFKIQVLEKIQQNIPKSNRIEIDICLPIRRRISETIDAMYLGYDLIVRGGIFGMTSLPSQIGWYSIPDMLVRSDKISKLFPEASIDLITDISQGHFYIPVDILFLTLQFSQRDKTKLLNSKNLQYYKALSILNQQSCIQMYRHQFNVDDTSSLDKYFGIILGRPEKTRMSSVITTASVKYDSKLFAKSVESLEWIVRVEESSASNWKLYPPTVTELYPNMRNMDEDYPWHQAKKIIAQHLQDITLIWNCGPQQRQIAHQKGIFNWNKIGDPKTELSLGSKKSQIVDKIITVNREEDIIVSPRKLKRLENIKLLEGKSLEFFVDFETVQEPEEEGSVSNGAGFLFMIGCVSRYKINQHDYHCEYKSFVVYELTRKEEQRITREWIDYMSHFQKLYPESQPSLYHWSPAEPVIYQQLTKKWRQILPVLSFVDLLHVFQSEPIVVKGAFGYNLKEISRALHHHNYISTLWNDNVIDGKDAMIRAWCCYQPQNIHEKKDVLGHIEYYNYVDCKVMEEIITFLREKLL